MPTVSLYGVQVTAGAPSTESGKKPRLHRYSVVEVRAVENAVGKVVAVMIGAVKGVQ